MAAHETAPGYNFRCSRILPVPSLSQDAKNEAAIRKAGIVPSFAGIRSTWLFGRLYTSGPVSRPRSAAARTYSSEAVSWKALIFPSPSKFCQMQCCNLCMHFLISY